jgi:hypothetical protein
MKAPSKKYLLRLSEALEDKTSGTIPLDVAHKWASTYISSEYHKDTPEDIAEMVCDCLATNGGANDKRRDVIDDFLRDTDDNYSKAKDGDSCSWSYHIDLEAYWSSCLRYDWNEVRADDGRLFYFWNR